MTCPSPKKWENAAVSWHFKVFIKSSRNYLGICKMMFASSYLCFRIIVCALALMFWRMVHKPEDIYSRMPRPKVNSVNWYFPVSQYSRRRPILPVTQLTFSWGRKKSLLGSAEVPPGVSRSPSWGRPKSSLGYKSFLEVLAGHPRFPA